MKLEGGSPPRPRPRPSKRLQTGPIEQLAPVDTKGVVPTMLEPGQATKFAKLGAKPKVAPKPAQAEQALASGSIGSATTATTPWFAQSIALPQQQHGWHLQTAWPALPQPRQPQNNHRWHSPPAAQVAVPMLAIGSTQAMPQQQPQHQLEPEPEEVAPEMGSHRLDAKQEVAE